MKWKNGLCKVMILSTFCCIHSLRKNRWKAWYKMFDAKAWCSLGSALTYLDNCSVHYSKKNCAEWFRMCKSGLSVLAWLYTESFHPYVCYSKQCFVSFGLDSLWSLSEAHSEGVVLHAHIDFHCEFAKVHISRKLVDCDQFQMVCLVLAILVNGFSPPKQ
jgi:hypothetical protein